MRHSPPISSFFPLFSTLAHSTRLLSTVEPVHKWSLKNGSANHCNITEIPKYLVSLVPPSLPSFFQICFFCIHSNWREYNSSLPLPQLPSPVSFFFPSFIVLYL